MLVHHTVSFVKLVFTSAATTSVAHGRVVLGSYLAAAVTWSHHSEDLGETLAILGQMIINKKLVWYYLPWRFFLMAL